MHAVTKSPFANCLCFTSEGRVSVPGDPSSTLVALKLWPKVDCSVPANAPWAQRPRVPSGPPRAPTASRSSPEGDSLFSPWFLKEKGRKGHFSARVRVDELGERCNFSSGHPFRLTNRPPKEGASVGPELPPPSSGTWPAVRAAFSGPRPRVTCLEPPWKPAPAALPPSCAARVAHPPSQALTLNLGAGRRDASRALTPAYLTPGARRSLVGDSPWRWRRGGALGTPGPRRGSEARLTALAAAPPLATPPPRRPRAAQCSARRRVRHKQTQLGHTWTAEQLRPATDRGFQTPGLRKPEPPGRAGERTELRLGSGHCHLAPLLLHGSAAAAAAAALAFRGPSRQRVQALL